MSGGSSSVVLWNNAEPGVEERDLAAVTAFAPDLSYIRPFADDKRAFHGAWRGRIPVWPFDRAEPAGLRTVVPVGVEVDLRYPAAYPMVAPRVWVVDPEPLLEERTQQRWHVAPGGSLCLLQSDGEWTPETTPVELLLKAAGWRIEYALMKADMVESMTVNGIVTDDTLDILISDAVSR